MFGTWPGANLRENILYFGLSRLYLKWEHGKETSEAERASQAATTATFL